MEFETILLEERDGIFVLTINRPKVLNALNHTVLTELDRAIDFIKTKENTLGLVITGAGEKSFVAGADISEFQGKTPEEARKQSEWGQSIFKKIEDLPFPSIAAINGFALGGGLELAMSCTFRYASPNAKVGQPEVKLGLIPGYAGTQRLTRLIGHSKAMEICMTGRMVSAEEALKIGIVDRIVEENLVDEAIKSIKDIQKNSPIAVYYCKKAIMEGKEMPFEKACALESNLFGLCFATEDAKEGVSAFLEKREAKFKGK
ncbi:3-hydroxybutyryl-CoA dehydratase [Thermotomaculum hydrothermale]|uniref:3-hydroxybutyryl-CoA dehydratase n=1 Tax=Thermotomaculum hydrothermale TaxID=981385 RepID=A0A7R6PZ61_9BACT|nr:enoyl-CoA hydratase-related protein [Thermotomaculum hydrothermale]BBB33605.1 3-hydroxybutyryl-CoA dehydratase [Thermotomaculum hydrothermale]